MAVIPLDSLCWAVSKCECEGRGYSLGQFPSLIVGIGWCVYAVFVAFAVLAALIDLGDVAD